MTNSIFRIVETTDEQIVLKVEANDNLTIAKHPYISGEYDYITVTRCRNHMLTIVFKDSHTFSFNWGGNSYTCISQNLELLRQKVCEFIDKQNILLELTSSHIDSAVIYYNTSYRKWQLTLNRNCCYFSETATSLDEMKKDISRFITVCGWAQNVAPTGITVWDAIGSIELTDNHKND